MKKIILGIAFFASVSAHAFTEGLTYNVSFQSGYSDDTNIVTISNIKFNDKDIYASSDADKYSFSEKICESFNGVSRSTGLFFYILVTGKDGQIFESEPLGVPVRITINNPMAIVENGNITVRKVENQTVTNMYPVVTCEVEKRSGWF